MYISGSLIMTEISRVPGCSFMTAQKEPAPVGIMENKPESGDLKRVLKR